MAKKSIYKDLSDSEVRAKVYAKFNGLLEKTDRDKVNNIGKLWIYENHVVSRITWEFIIYSFPITFAESLQTTANRYLKKWAGLARCANPSILFRSREKKGLQMKALTTHLYDHMLARLKGKKNWNGAKELEERESVIYSLMSSVEVSKEGMELVL